MSLYRACMLASLSDIKPNPNLTLPLPLPLTVT